MTDIFDLHELLVSFGLEADEDVKLYRHVTISPSQDPFARDIEQIIEMGDLDIFQSVQSSRQLGSGRVAFFMAEADRQSRFLGVWRVLSIHDWQHQSPDAEAAREKTYLREGGIWHLLERDPRFDKLANRLVIEWPTNGRPHHLWLIHNGVSERKVPVHQLRATGVTRAFPGFDDVLIKHHELCTLVRNAAEGWKQALTSTRGVYLIADDETGELYVGSATSAGGIWERWTSYVKTSHGGNKVLIDRVMQIEKFTDRLTFSILETLGNLASRNDGIQAEIRWKKKLGKKAIVLNAN